MSDKCDSLTEGSATSGRVSRQSYFSVGREFYDDEYSDGEESLEEFLDFSDLKVRGRENELQRLHDVYSHVQRLGVDVDKPREREETAVAMIKGLSGTGKSTLVKQFIEDLDVKSKIRGGPIKPFFLSGKYDELSGADPFSAIVEAFSSFASSLMEGEKNELERIRKKIKGSLGSEANVLTTVIPALRAVIGDDLPISGSKENAWNRLKYIFQVFSNAISSAERPVVLFLDDLQWCDSASMELIKTLLADNDSRYMMFIGSYRAEEVQEGHEFLGHLETISKTQHIEFIELVNLSVDQLCEFVADALKFDEASKALPLVEPIHRKTKGNIFFTMQVLEELQRKDVLQFSRMTFEWEWHLDEVDLDALLPDDVLQALTSKIASAPEILQKALVIAAYTRSTIDIHTLQKLMELDGCPIESELLVKTLDKAVIEGLLSNSMGSQNYSFGHDRIQQAAYAMVPPGSARDEFRYAMGHRLYKMGSSESGEDWILFAAADHLNATASKTMKDPMFLTRINLEVGDRAGSVAAYETASKFLGMAMQTLLRMKNPWVTQYDTTLHIYQAIADVELCQGHFEIGKGIGDQVLSNAQSLDDKLPTQLALSKALGREEKHKDSFKLSVKALRPLREYPKGIVGMHVGLINDLIFVKRYFKKKTDKDILAEPLMEIKRKESIMELLSSAAYQAYYCGNMVAFLATTLKMLRITFRYGLCGQAGVAMMGYCLFCNNMNDMEGANRFSQLACQILELTKAKELECLQIFVVAHWINAWKDPHSEVLELYNRAHKSGMESGEFEDALLSRTAGYHHEFVAGYPLAPIDVKYANLMEKLDIYKIESVQVMSVEQWLVVQHLRGSASSPLNFAELDKFGPIKNDGSESYQLLYGYMGRLELGVYFGDYSFAERMMEKLVSVADFDKSHSTNCIRLFFSSLACSSIARTTGKKSYLSKARKYGKQLKSLCKNKGMNSWHRCLLMEAHLRSSGGKKGTSVQASYDYAIATAVKSGHKHDAALGAQLAGEYFLSMRNDILHSAILAMARDKLVRQYLKQARDFYKQWGATGFVNYLEEKHGAYLDSTTTEEPSSAVISSGTSFNSLELGNGIGSLPPLPKLITGKSPQETKDDVSVMTSQTAWREAAYFSNPHTMGGDFPSLADA